MKIKLFLLSLVAGFLFVGFSSAGLMDFSYNCSSTTFCNLPSGVRSLKFDKCIPGSDVQFYFSSDSDCVPSLYYSNELGSDTFKNSKVSLVAGQVNSLSSLSSVCGVSVYAYNCSSFPVNFTFKTFVPPLLPGGSEALSGVVSNLSSSINEFIPYIVYIGVGILGAIIGFVAIKWLINRIRSKTLSPFR